MTPLRITFTFTQPVVRDSDHPIQLDALLAWCAAQEAQQYGSDTAWQDAEDLSHLLERSNPQDDGLHDSQWVWKASQLVFTPATERFMQGMIRKLEPEAYMQAFDSGLIKGRTRTYMNSGSGQERSYQIMMPYQWMDKAQAWCIGNAQEISQALGWLKGIGKMTRNGYGTIRHITIEQDEAAAQQWKNRILPVGMPGIPGLPYVATMHCLRAPYWKKVNKTLTMEPILS